MSIETKAELQGMEAVGRAVAMTLKSMQEYARPGMSTLELDQYGATILATFGARSAPKKDYNFPGVTCISVNHEICHGIPRATTILREGDLVNIDVSASLNGYYGDNGCSFVLGEDKQHLQPLVDASRSILKLAISEIKSNVRISAIGGLIEREARKRGFRVIKNLCGHGIGRRLHEAPREIPNFKDHFNRGRLRKNMVIALETFISTRGQIAYEQADGWTMQTKDRSFVAQHEHTLVVTDGAPIILTAGNGV